MPDIHLDQPSIGKLELDYVSRATREGAISTRSKYVDLFEERLTSYLNVQSVICTNSGTTALIAGIFASYPVSSIITLPALTFVATANATRLTDHPVSVSDIDPDTWVMHPQADEANSLPVDLYGVPVGGAGRLVDACQSIGARRSGVFAISFNHNKTITCGGGGALVNLPPHHADLIRTMLNQGMAGGHQPIVGFNGRMTGLHASIGLAQLERADHLLAIKRHIHSLYTESLSDIVKFQSGPRNSTWWMTACTTPVPAAKLQILLANSGVPTRRVFPPLHFLLPNPVSPTRCPNAERIWEYGICLPSSTLNSSTIINRVCKLVRSVIKECS